MEYEWSVIVVNWNNNQWMDWIWWIGMPNQFQYQTNKGKEQPSHNDCHSHTLFVMEMEIELWNGRIIGNSSLKTHTSNQP